MSKFRFRITANNRPFFNGRPTDAGEEIEVDEATANLIEEMGWGESLNSKTVTEKKGKKRARTKSGHYKADDPNTPENEAYE